MALVICAHFPDFVGQLKGLVDVTPLQCYTERVVGIYP